MVKLYSIRECSELLGMTVRTVRQWIRDGKINAIKYKGSNMWRIPETEILRIRSNGNENR